MGLSIEHVIQIESKKSALAVLETQRKVYEAQIEIYKDEEDSDLEIKLLEASEEICVTSIMQLIREIADIQDDGYSYAATARDLGFSYLAYRI